MVVYRWAVVLAVLAASACRASGQVAAPPPPYPVEVREGEALAARVGAEPLPARLVEQDLAAWLALVGRGTTTDEVAARRWELTQRWITRMLAAGEARRRGVTVSREEVDRAVQTGTGLPPAVRQYYLVLRERHGVSLRDLRVRVQLDLYLARLRELLVEEIRKSLREDDVWGYYRSHLALFQHPEQVYVWVIAVRDRQLAHRIAARARAGEEFGALAERYSVHPTRAKRGEFGWLSRGGTAFEPLFELAPGEVSDPIEYQGHWLVVKVTARRPAGTWPFDEVKGDVERMLLSERLRDRQAELDRELRARTRIEVFLPRPSSAPSP